MEVPLPPVFSHFREVVLLRKFPSKGLGNMGWMKRFCTPSDNGTAAAPSVPA